MIIEHITIGDMSVSLVYKAEDKRLFFSVTDILDRLDKIGIAVNEIRQDEIVIDKGYNELPGELISGTLCDDDY